MKTVTLTVVIKIQELSNIPHFDSFKCFATVSETHSCQHPKVRTDVIAIENHKAAFTERSYSFNFKASIDKEGNLQEKLIFINFYIKSPTNPKGEKLGDLTINLVDFFNKSKASIEKYLLENSKANAIAKLSIIVKRPTDSTDSSILDKTRLSSSRHSIIESPTFPQFSKRPPDEISPSLNDELPLIDKLTPNKFQLKSPSSPLGNSSISNNQLFSKQLNDTHSMMIDALEDSINGESCDILNNLFNKTYRFTWQLEEHNYDEFTPVECIKDIVERNGNGWKKNDEGFDMVDVIQAEYWDKFNNDINNYGKANSSNNKSGLPDDDEDDENNDWAQFDVEEDTLQFKKANKDITIQNIEDEDEENEEDNRYHYHSGSTSRSFNKRVRPLSETQVREDLRSWHINVQS